MRATAAGVDGGGARLRTRRRGGRRRRADDPAEREPERHAAEDEAEPGAGPHGVTERGRGSGAVPA